jgi:hypothetical protein
MLSIEVTQYLLKVINYNDVTRTTKTKSEDNWLF